MRRCICTRGTAVCVLCAIVVCGFLLVSSSSWRTWLMEDVVMRFLRRVGPVLRGECLPTSGPQPENVSIAVVTLSGAKDELYKVIYH